MPESEHALLYAREEAVLTPLEIKSFIVNSLESPEGNGLAERVVRIIKFCFEKLALEKGLDYEWDELLCSNSLLQAKMLRGGEATGVGMFTFTMWKFAMDGVTTKDAEQGQALLFQSVLLAAATDGECWNYELV
ncbi:hypothetical protein CYMTET_23002 [Cymbomonas tetramitiformis]|uniref:Uncharacterized protein n=1 Tax=Cymbomonas tetramitiformis TaxID=36881 RepID=A0AAE0FYT4_9CHLO|nr:hypothetical protein CYMTET_23002 [Cymbomonas tetramitiformis]